MNCDFNQLNRYIKAMPTSMLILWCYVAWYLVMVIFHLKVDLQLWVNSLGISIIVGLALVLATGDFSSARLDKEFWQVLRLFLCPFLVSSFSSVRMGNGFFLIFSSQLFENIVAATFCIVIVFFVRLVKRM